MSTPQLQPLELPWIITVVIAIVASLSPIFVALINNAHAKAMRKLEISHTEKLKRMELSYHMTEKQFEIYYGDKKAAFCDFLQEAGAFTGGSSSLSFYQALHSATDRALLLCNSHNQKQLCDFINRIDNDFFGADFARGNRAEYTFLLTSLATSLNDELSSTKPSENCI